MPLKNGIHGFFYVDSGLRRHEGRGLAYLRNDPLREMFI
jgi:hypothetical protein